MNEGEIFTKHTSNTKTVIFEHGSFGLLVVTPEHFLDS